MLARAIEVATRAHEGKSDKGGLPYVTHPLRVMVRTVNRRDLLDNPLQLLNESLSRQDIIRACIAVLHDTVEDTGVTLESLRVAGFPEEVVTGVDSVTKRNGEPYRDFLRRAANDPNGIYVKRADVEDNTDPARMKLLDQAEQNRLSQKYDGAQAFLEAIIAERESGLNAPAFEPLS